MVGLVLVSHSRALAEATLTLVRAMSGDEVPIALAAGTGENNLELGTDAMEIYSAIETVYSNDGVLVLMDMGSAVLSAEMALDFLDDSMRKNIKLCPSSFVEGAVAAGVASKIGGSLDEVFREASVSLMQKEQHIQPNISISQEATTPTISKNALTIQVIVPNPNGLHARPVANLIQLASQFNSQIQIKNSTANKGPVSIKSMSSVVALEVLQGNTVELSAQGTDSEEALNELKKAIETGLGDSLDEVMKNDDISLESNALKPIGVSKGIVVGKAFYPKAISIIVPDHKITNSAKEIDKLHLAITNTIQELKQKSLEISKKLDKAQGEIFKAQSLMVEDPELINTAIDLINVQKYNVAFAWHNSTLQIIQGYKSLKDKNLQQRALDLQDASSLVLKYLGIALENKIQIPGKGVIVVKDITPTEVTTLNSNIQGVICLENGATSHSSILLRSRGIPSIVQASRLQINLLKEKPLQLAMDGQSGEIWINPNDDEITSILRKKQEEQKQEEIDKKESRKPAITLDGKTIKVFANVANAEDVKNAIENGAEGIGLFRTEFMFIERESAPTEEEQVETMRTILAPMKGKTIVIRTLDAGGDKPIPYLNMPKEENPFLGVRAIRLSLKNPVLFQQQLKAILRISTDFNIHIMFPMIATLEELEAAKAELEKAHQSLIKENTPHIWPITTGMMMEVPSAAIMAHKFTTEVDFISIGTNDLTQYTMAADRSNPELQDTLGKGLSSAVQFLIQHICNSSAQHNITVAVCGESASNPELASFLLKSGVDELSMNSLSIPSMKQWIRGFNTKN